MFGYPTGVGCLLARHHALGKLRRPWFSGGTISIATVQGDRYFFAPGSCAFQDGTLDYLSIPAVEIGLNHLHAWLDLTHQRVSCLTAWLLEEFARLRHATGTPVVRLYGPAAAEARGAAITMNFYLSLGEVVDHELVERLANRHRISLRTGCFCDPGSGEIALGISRSELLGCFEHPHATRGSYTKEDFRRCIGG